MQSSNQRRGNGSCGNQYSPFMMGGSQGYTLSQMPQGYNSSGQNCYPQQRDPQQQQQYSSRGGDIDRSANVRECMYWPASLNKGLPSRAAMQPTTYPSYQPAKSGAGDQMFCNAPPKVYLSTPGQKAPLGKGPQNIPCQIAPLGTDPSSLIKPLEPLTVRVQAPADLFTGDPSQPKTISISPAQLYGMGMR